MAGVSRELLLDCGAGVRLLAHWSSHGEAARDVVLLLHGWEGSAESQYVLSAASYLYDEGYDVVRLNLRDHGPTHHLNRDLFHSCRIDEVVGAVEAIASLVPRRRLLFLGYSLGGNFGLRVALRAPARGIPLDAVVAVCPVLDPKHTMERLEHGALIYRRYFAYKWARSLRRKQRAWPGEFDFRAILKDPRLSSMTRNLVATYTDYPSTEAYLDGYALVGATMSPLEIPALILAAADDPIIPAEDFERLARPSNLQVDLQTFGGHCGFLSGLGGPSWADRRISRWFKALN
jgi:predicted alpha/beta-fold hydrolase